MSLLAELKRRHVLRVAVAYLVAAWVAIQVAATVAPLLSMPEWVPKLVVLLAIIGLPVALVLAWMYDIGARGVERTTSAALVDAAAAPASSQPGAAATRDASFASLAVLPLQAVDAAADDPLADGLTEALITELARASALKVISRSSVARFRNSSELPREIARQLGVDALVTGSVRRSGDRIRVSVELMDPASESVRWANRYDRELEDVLRLQEEIAVAISGEVRQQARGGPGPQQLPRRVMPEVYLLDLRGRRLMESRTEEGLRAALGCFEKALNLDPTFGASYIGIARAYNMLANYGLTLPAQARPRVRAAIERAQALGADEAEAQGELAHLLWQFDFDWHGADAAYQRALALAPSDARLWYWRGTMLSVSGQLDAGLAAIARSEELDPLSPMIPTIRGWIHYFAGRHAEAIAALRDVLALHPDLAPAYWFLGMALTASGDHDAAIRSYEASIARTGRISRLLGYLGHAAGRAGRAAQAQELLEELRQRAATAYVPAYFPALVHAGLGEHDAALGELERALAQRDTMLRDLLVDASFDQLRAEPRFRAILEALHLPAGHG